MWTCVDNQRTGHAVFISSLMDLPVLAATRIVESEWNGDVDQRGMWRGAESAERSVQTRCKMQAMKYEMPGKATATTT